jgi:hypothetical protein
MSIGQQASSMPVSHLQQCMEALRLHLLLQLLAHLGRLRPSMAAAQLQEHILWLFLESD